MATLPTLSVQQATPSQLWTALVRRLAAVLDVGTNKFVLVTDGPQTKYDGDGYFYWCRFDDLTPQPDAGAGRWGTPCTLRAIFWITSRSLSDKAGSDLERLTRKAQGLYDQSVLLINALHLKMLYVGGDLTGATRPLTTRPMQLDTAGHAQTIRGDWTTALAPIGFLIEFTLPVTKTDDAVS